MTVAIESSKAPASAAVAPPPPEQEARLKALYSVMQSIENKLGGGEGVEGLYGSIKKSGMDRVLECMRAQCGLDSSSVLVDVGAGLGRPLMHALLAPGIAGARGVEIDRIKCDKAAAFLRQAVAELERRGVLASGAVTPPPIECSAIEKVRSLDPCTHAYSFWEGVPIDGKAAFGRLFAASRTLRAVAVVQRAIRTCPVAYMADLGFGELELVASFSVSMSGSGRSFTAYVFNKADQLAPLPAPVAVPAEAAQSVETPAQPAQPAAAVPSQDSVAPAEAPEAEEETAQSRLAGVGRGRRTRKPSARQQAAAESEDALAAVERQTQAQARRAREQRAQRRGASDASKPAAQQAAAAPAAQAAQEEQRVRQDVQQAAEAEAPLESPRRLARSVSRQAAAPKPTAPPAAKLSSPQRAGVQKRSSPTKGGTATLPLPARRTSPRKLAMPSTTAKDGAGAEEPAAVLAGPFAQAAARVTKASAAAAAKAGAAAAPKALQRKVAARQSTRRGLLSGSNAAQ